MQKASPDQPQNPFTALSLLRTPPPSFVPDIARVLNAVNEVFPLKSQHRRSLPQDVRDLSQILTEERARLKTPYWAAPRFLSAYLRYFLPWNLLRLSWLLPNLELGLQNKDLVLDCGSGPLTLPLGLWLTRPDLRHLELEFICSDSSSAPLETGKKLFQAISGPKCPWHINVVRANIRQSLEKAARSQRKAGLIMMGNVLNEVASGQRQPLDTVLGDLSRVLRRAVRPHGQIFTVEPGTRLGAKLIGKLRLHALHQGCEVQAPCTHAEECPMLDPRAKFWCHFNFPVREIPKALSGLSEAAKLIKSRASLSCLLLKTPEHAEPASDLDDDDFDEDYDFDAEYGTENDGYPDDVNDDDTDDEHYEGQRGHSRRAADDFSPEDFAGPLPGRVVSGAILLPGAHGGPVGEMEGRYVCTAAGLTLARPLRAAEGAHIEIELTGGRDPRSQALLAAPTKKFRDFVEQNLPHRSNARSSDERPYSARHNADHGNDRRPARPYGARRHGGQHVGQQGERQSPGERTYGGAEKRDRETTREPRAEYGRETERDPAREPRRARDHGAAPARDYGRSKPFQGGRKK